MSRTTPPKSHLTERQRTELLECLKKETSEEESLFLGRLAVILLMDAGVSKVELAKGMGLSRATLYNWLSCYQKQGLKGLRRAGRAGPEVTGKGGDPPESNGAEIAGRRPQSEGGFQLEVTLRDIASAAGVSLSTASLAVSGRRGVSDQLRKQVLQVVNKMGYRPHPHLSTLMKQVGSRRRARTRVNLAWIHHGRVSYEEDFKNPWGWYPVYQAALERVREHGYDSLEPYWCPSDGVSASQLARILKSRGILGALVAAGTDLMPKFSELSDMTLVKLTEPLITSRNHHVYANTYQGVLLACSNLWQAGYRRIGFLSGITHNLTLVGRNEAAWHDFQNAIPEDLRIAPLVDDLLTAQIFEKHFVNVSLTGHVRLPAFLDDDDWMSSFGELEKAYRQEKATEQAVKSAITTVVVDRWLKESHPDAIICMDSRIVNRVQSLGYRVPEDMGVVHLNLTPDVKSWSGVNQHHEKIGSLAADTLEHVIAMGQIGQTDYPVLRSVSGSWVEGRTTQSHAPPVYPHDSIVEEWIRVRGNTGP